jgi:glycosyltransferase involved in cell wall biosynthesis
VVSLRGSDVPGFASQRLASWQRLVLRPWIRRTLLQADAVAPNNPHLRDLAIRFEPRISEKTSLLPNGVDLSGVATGPARSGPDEFRLVTVAQFIPRKRLELGIEVVRGLWAAGVPARLTLVGEGPQESALRRHAQRLGVAERVDFAGLRPRAEVAQLLRRQDAFLLTSQAEGASNAVLEAMAAGLPIVTTCNGAHDLVLEAGCGTVVPAAEYAVLVDALRTLWLNPGERGQLAEAGLRYARSHTWERSAEQLEAIFAGLGVGCRQLL